MRQGVVWIFGKVITEFAFLDFFKYQKLFMQNVDANITYQLSQMFIRESMQYKLC